MMTSVSSPVITSQPGVLGIPESSPTEIVQSAPRDNSLEAFYNAVRFGLRSQVVRILDSSESFVTEFDSQGYSSVHWAAKKGDYEMLQTLFSYGAPLNVPTRADARMFPAHWAASDGKIAAIRFLLEKGQDLNVQDANGCTPLVVAAQHNHIACVVYLIQNGADVLLPDSNGDTCLHWAAYKGYVELIGYLSYAMKHENEREDVFGQTPLHLAALRGNIEVVEFLVIDCHVDISKKDRNGQTALELAAKKSQLKVEYFLRRFSSKNRFPFLTSMEIYRAIGSKASPLILFGANEKELAYWAWRIVFLSNFIGSLVSLTFMMNENLADLYCLHYMNTMLQFLWWISFVMCLMKSPSFVRDEDNMYQKTIADIGKALDENDLPSICHTCRVRRPLRSKHCKIQRRCVQKFDHFCPFVGNTVGRDNYCYFYSLLVLHTICGTLWEITAFYLARRVSVSWCFVSFIIYSFFWMFMILGLLNYHTQLITSNMTTNEHINAMKYSYMKSVYGTIDSPFDRKSSVANCIDGLFPSEKNYYSRAEVRMEMDKARFSDKSPLMD